MPKLSFLIPAWNEQEHLSRAISSIHASCAEIKFDDYEIVVCDNNSTDRTPAIARDCGVKVIFEPVNRISRARNSAAKASSGEWLIFLDADTVLNPGVLSRTLFNLQSGFICGGGARMRFDDGAGIVARFLAATWNFCAPALSLAAGGYLYCCREAWQGVRGFDESLYVSEDAVFAWRVAGWGRARKLLFVTVMDKPVVTSARKFRMYGAARVVWQLVRLALPGARRRSISTRQWYER
jgi:glycosyltransferase involved in cell wall biosynthesis